MKKNGAKLLAFTFLLCAQFLLSPLSAQNSSDDDGIEVYLSFRHRGVINSMVTAYYKDNEFYLPVNEIFSLFQIDYKTDGLVTRGRFAVDQIPYSIDFSANTITLGGQAFQITQDGYLIKELDNYLKPQLFFEIFKLDFSIDFNNLSLSLETNTELPVIASALREQRRTLANRNRFEQENFELRYPRERPFLDGGFMDYNFSGSFTRDQSLFNYNSNIGLQVYGGDFQGIVFGNVSGNNNNFATNNMRWRYRYLDNPVLSTLIIGQTTTDGITRQSYTGIRLSNDPIEPRRLFDEFEIQGNTIPESEVELYLNNMLIDFQQANELGDYRFLAPISYGTSQLDLNIYGPTGQIIEQSRRLQIPFNFQPQGVFNYQFNAGRLDNPIFGSTKQQLTAQANGAYGINNWLTAKAGVEYYEDYHDALPTFTSTISSRILHNYLLTLEAASQAYYRGALNVIYPNSASFNVDYTHFTSGIGIYNPSNDDQRIVASAFYPFSIFNVPFNIRASAYSRFRGSTNSTTFRMNASSRLGKLNLRFSYSDRYTDSFDILNPSSTAYLESSATYNISRKRSLPIYLRGVYLRAQLRYFPVTKQFESAEIIASQNIFKMGRLQLSYGRNFTGNFNLFRFSLVVDFEKFRSGTTFNSSRNNFNIAQNVRGSIGYDSNYNNFIFTSRDQVGRSAAAIRLFVDNNANQIFDEGDDPITENAVRVNRSGATGIVKNNVLYYTQMQPYYYYNLELNKGVIRNPMLVPEVDRFGMITDPNRFKKVELPFYMSGVIEGKVEREFSSGRIGGIAGLKLNLQKQDGEFEQEIRTFSDGSFYAYEIPPGHYEIQIDSTQLEILDSFANPDSIAFEVQAIPEGDFVEGLYFLLKPRALPEPIIEVEELEITTLEEGRCNYILQMGSFAAESAAKNAASLLSEESNPFIVYNEETRLYAVRVTAFPSLSQASDLVYQLYASNYDDVAILHDCSDATDGTVFDLQLRTFNNQSAATTYITQLSESYDLEFYVEEDENGLFHVIQTSFNSVEAAQERKAEILALYPDLNIPIVKKSYTTTIRARYQYLLQIGNFENEREAELFASRFRDSTQYSSNIVVDESGVVSLFISTPFSRWSNLLNVRNDIAALPDFKMPIIHLSEPN